jgi:hypothetical protein
MSTLSKPSTIYFDPAIYNALKIKSALSNLSVSEIVDEAVRELMNEYLQDLSAFSEHEEENEVGFELLLNNLKKYEKV